MPVRKTKEQFLKDVMDLVGDEYTFLEDYQTSRIPMSVRHNKCGYEYKTKATPFLRGHGCPKCAGTLKKTTESFTEEVVELVGEEYSVLGEYKKNNIKIKMRHNECGNVFMMEPVSFTRGYRCPKCAIKNKTKTNEQFIKEAYKVLGEGYTILGEYVNARSKLNVRHDLCGKEYLAKPSKILEGFGRCSECREYKVDIKRYIKERANNEYELLEKYKGYHNRIKIKHSICGYEFSVFPSNFIAKNSRCPMCAGLRVSHEMFKNKFDELLGEEYTLLSEYKNAKTKLRVRHNLCGKEYFVLSNGVIRGSRCPFCISSSGERAVANILSNMKIDYTAQFKTNMCRHVNMLPFDFAIHGSEKEIIALIEYDGQQHFEAVDHFGGTENFEMVKMRDGIKNDFCKANNIPLLRIPYWKYDDLEYVIFDHLVDLGILEKEREIA